MRPANDHMADRGEQATQASMLPRRLTKITTLCELAAIIAEVPNTMPFAGTYSWDRPRADRVEICVVAGDRKFTRGMRVEPNASRADLEAARDQLHEALLRDLIREAANPDDRIMPLEKPLPLRDRLAHVGTLLFIATWVLFTGGKRGA